MIVYNAGLEIIKFGFNASSRSKRYGGFYKLLPGEQRDIPEDAKDHVIDPHCGPGLRGLVILEFGSDLQAKIIQGLEAYIKFAEFGLRMEEARTTEMEQVGTKFSYERKEVTKFKKKMESGEIAKTALENKIKAKELAEKDPVVKIQNLKDMIAKANAELAKLTKSDEVKLNAPNSHSDNRLPSSQSTEAARG